MRRDRGAERVTGGGNGRARGQRGSEVVEGGVEVVLLAATFVEHAGRSADTTEIEPQRREPGLATHLGDAHDDRVLHVATVQRMRVT